MKIPFHFPQYAPRFTDGDPPFPPIITPCSWAKIPYPPTQYNPRLVGEDLPSPRMSVGMLPGLSRKMPPPWGGSPPGYLYVFPPDHRRRYLPGCLHVFPQVCQQMCPLREKPSPRQRCPLGEKKDPPHRDAPWGACSISSASSSSPSKSEAWLIDTPRRKSILCPVFRFPVTGGNEFPSVMYGQVP